MTASLCAAPDECGLDPRRACPERVSDPAARRTTPCTLAATHADLRRRLRAFDLTADFLAADCHDSMGPGPGSFDRPEGDSHACCHDSTQAE